MDDLDVYPIKMAGVVGNLVVVITNASPTLSFFSSFFFSFFFYICSIYYTELCSSNYYLLNSLYV